MTKRTFKDEKDQKKRTKRKIFRSLNVLYVLSVLFFAPIQANYFFFKISCSTRGGDIGNCRIRTPTAL